MNSAWVSLFLWMILVTPGLRANPTPRLISPFAPLQETPLPPGVEVEFAESGTDLTGRVAEFISAARHEVLISAYALTEQRVLDAMTSAFRRGIMVAALLDPKPAVRDYDTPTLLRSVGIPVVKARRGPRGAGWHDDKFIIIDRDTLLLISSDLTSSARANTGNLLVLRLPSITSRYFNLWLLEASQGERLP